MRCGFYYYLDQLEEQFEWRGPALGSLGIIVCKRTCLDVPNEQLRTIEIGPDPVPPRRPSPTFYDQQNASPGYTPRNAPLFDDKDDQLTDDNGNPLTAV